MSLGEVDAGFVYESTYTAAPKNTYLALTIPKADNYLQTYSIGILKESTTKGAAANFENFMTSALGSRISGPLGSGPSNLPYFFTQTSHALYITGSQPDSPHETFR